MTDTANDLAEVFRRAANEGRPMMINSKTARELADLMDAAHTCVTDHAAILAGQDAALATYLKVRGIQERAASALAEAKRIRRQASWMVCAQVVALVAVAALAGWQL